MIEFKTITVNASLVNSAVESAASMSGDVSASADVSGNISASGQFASVIGHNTVNDYNLLNNKPQINSVTLQGNKSLPDIGVNSLSNMDLEHLLT